ncbi:MAG: CvpA family protein [Firmicutes bacterium]|nr:CvpA family protein [Bacillota bacterium]
MTWVDGIIVLLLAVMMLKGFVKGLVREASELAGVVFAILYAYKHYHYWGDELIYRFGLPELIARTLAFGAIVIAISLLAGLIGALLSKVMRFTPVGILDHVAGVGLGFAKGFILSCLLLVLLAQLPLDGVNKALHRSPLAQQVLGVVPRLYDGLEGYLPPGFPKWHVDDGDLHFESPAHPKQDEFSNSVVFHCISSMS